jgi:uncharacterized protein (TIGR00270 family)
MALCEMCGREASLVRAEIEGGELSVCSPCAGYGKVKKEVRPVTVRRKETFQKPEYKLVDDFSNHIKAARESRNLNREDFSKLLNERESVIAKWEQGQLRPRIDVARAVGKKLGLTLVVRMENSAGEALVQKKSVEPTLGDFIKVRKRK